MATLGMKINRESIEAKIKLALEKKGQPVAEKIANQIFRRAHRAMLREFDRHPITAELLAGPRGINFSDTLDGYGNLFSFIGFEAGSNPTGPLRDVIELGTNINYTVFRNNAWYFRIRTPSRDAIEAVTPMPWEGGNSWAFAVEKGMSNLSNYLYKKTSKSRSGTGIQVGDFEVNDDIQFNRTKYLSEIFDNFRDKINNAE